MKKLFVLLVAVVIVLPAIALSEGVFTDGWLDASLDDLLKAKNALNQQIAKAMFHQEAPAAGFTIEGEGTDIADGFTLSEGLWRRTFSVPNAVMYEDKITLSKGGKNETVDISDAVIVVPVQSKGQTDVDYVMVETDSSWCISYEPIGMDGTLEASGDGGFVGNCFACTVPTIVEIEAKNGHGNLTNFQVRLYSVSSRGTLSSEYGSELMLNELIGTGESASYRAIIKPEDDIVAYLWSVETDQGVTWSISAK